MVLSRELPRRKTDGASQFIGNSHQLLRSFFWSYIPSKGRSPGSQDPNFLLQHIPVSLVFAYGIDGQENF